MDVHEMMTSFYSKASSTSTPLASKGANITFFSKHNTAASSATMAACPQATPTGTGPLSKQCSINDDDKYYSQQMPPSPSMAAGHLLLPLQ
jgi:hypothetical protein